MSRYVAFLRGVNVGGRIIKMADLKICLEKAGLADVRTLLQSGNVVFGSQLSGDRLKVLIEDALTKTFGYEAKVQVMPIGRLEDVVQDYPFGVAGEAQHDYVVFMENGLEGDVVAETFKLADGEQVIAGAGVVYWRVDKGQTLKSDFAKVLTKTKYKTHNTNRNLKTLKKIIQL